MLDATYLPTRPSGAKEGVQVAWCYDEEGRRELLAVRLGQRESLEDWLDLGHDLLRRGLMPPLLVVSDGAPGLVRAVEELWPDADRQRCTVHRLRNVLAKLPRQDKELHRRIEAGEVAGGGQTSDEGNWSVPRRDELPEPVLGGARPVHRECARARAATHGAP